MRSRFNNAEIAKVGQWTFQLNMEIRPIVGWRKGDCPLGAQLR
jgi:hypothetical protein